MFYAQKFLFCREEIELHIGKFSDSDFYLFLNGTQRIQKLAQNILASALFYIIRKKGWAMQEPQSS